MEDTCFDANAVKVLFLCSTIIALKRGEESGIFSAEVNLILFYYRFVMYWIDHVSKDLQQSVQGQSLKMRKDLGL